MTDVEPHGYDDDEGEVESRWQRWKAPLLVAAGLIVLILLLMLPSLIARGRIDDLEDKVEDVKGDLRESEGRTDALESGLAEANKQLMELGEPPVTVPEDGTEVDDPEPDDPEVQDSERQDLEVQDPEIQDAEVNDLDPFDDPDLLDDPDPDDPEIQEGEVQEAEIQEAPIPGPVGPAGPACPAGYSLRQVRIPSVSNDAIFLICARG